MSQVGSDRAPIEIWHQIFRNVLATSLVPSTDPYGNGVYGIISNITLFWESCPSSAEYRRVESARAVLRLVCRSWNTQLDPSGAGGAFLNQFAITDLRGKHWPDLPAGPPSQIRRLQVTVARSIWCRCPFPCIFRERWDATMVPTPKHFTRLVGDQSTQTSAQLYTTQRLPNLQVLIISSQAFSTDALTILYDSPALRVLSLDATPLPDGMPSISLIFPGPFDKLFYLRLSSLSISIIEQLQGEMNLPNLRLLELQFQSSMGHNVHSSNISIDSSSLCQTSSSLAASLTGWRFPALRSLTVCGGVEGALGPQLDAFISQCSRTVTDVSLLYVIGDDLWGHQIEISPTLRKDFPHLSVYGANLSSLIDYSPPSGTLQVSLSPITMLLDIDPEVLPGPLPAFDICMYAKSALRACSIIGCDSIVLLSSWEDLWIDVLDAAWEGFAIDRLRLFFIELETGGVRICDRHGLHFEGEGDARLGLPSHRGESPGVDVLQSEGALSGKYALAPIHNV